MVEGPDAAATCRGMAAVRMRAGCVRVKRYRPDTLLSAAASAAEAAHIDPNVTRATLEAQMKALEAINLMDGG
jgi:hypothetical protein